MKPSYPPRTLERTWDQIVLEAIPSHSAVLLRELYQAVLEEDSEAGSWDISNGGAEAEIRAALRRLLKTGQVTRIGRATWVRANATQAVAR